jgi:hypothetical protein
MHVACRGQARLQRRVIGRLVLARAHAFFHMSAASQPIIGARPTLPRTSVLALPGVGAAVSTHSWSELKSSGYCTVHVLVLARTIIPNIICLSLGMVATTPAVILAPYFQTHDTTRRRTSTMPS